MRILVFGDSFGAGFYDLEMGGWVNRLKILTDKKTVKNTDYDCSVYNLSVSGDSTRELLARFDIETKGREHSVEELVIIFAIGINDSYYFDKEKKTNVSEKDCIKNIQKLINLAKKYSSKIFFVGLTPVDQKKVNPVPWRTEISYDNNKIEAYDLIIKKICKENNIDFIDVMNKFKKENYHLLLIDGLHPNAKGHQLLFEIVRDFLEEKGII